VLKRGEVEVNSCYVGAWRMVQVHYVEIYDGKQYHLDQLRFKMYSYTVFIEWHAVT
jgi:hypothetical protein